jgi:hypothetical protein
MNHTEYNGTLWGNPEMASLDQPRRKRPFRFAFGSLVLGGTAPLLNLRLIELLRDGTYLTFPHGTRLREGETYCVARPLVFFRTSHISNINLRKVVATVQESSSPTIIEPWLESSKDLS